MGDFNGDGKADIVTANYGDDNVSVLLNDGTGAFIGPTYFPAGPGSQAVAIGDFNSDGKSDLVTANANASTVSLLLGNGLGSFGGPVNFNVGGQPTFVVAGEFSNDSQPDLAVARGNAVAMLFADEEGGFSGPILTPTTQPLQFLAAARVRRPKSCRTTTCL